MCVREEELAKTHNKGSSHPVAGNVKSSGGRCREALVVKVLPLLKEVQECGAEV